MSDQMERDIEEIMNRLSEPTPREGTGERVRRLAGGWTSGLRRTLASHVPRVSARQVKLASLGLVVVVAAGLFFGLVYPGTSLIGGGSADDDIVHESLGDQTDGGAGVGDARQDGSEGEALGTESDESREESDHEPDEHEEEDRGHGEDHH
jgi:hypothetical protein